MGDSTASTINSDVSTEQANKLLSLQRDIMEKVAIDHEQEYQTVLNQFCKATELLITDAVASIMVFDETHSFLNVLSAPSLPADAIQALNGLVPSERAGSCGTSVYSNKPQFVFNTRSDIRWADFHQFIIGFSVGACWSIPIKINDLGSVGSFALSSFKERRPTTFQIQLLETSASIAGIIIKRQQEQKHLWRMAHFDALTGLPNRTLLTLRLQHSLEKSQQNKQRLALLFLGLDNFKEINDTQGHDAGDEVLKPVATEMDDCLRPDDTFARLGGDEFVIIIDSFKDTEDLQIICNKILTTAKQCKHSSGFAISTSIGICIALDHGDNIRLLLHNADSAMDEALTKQHFCIHYQPQFDTQTSQLIGLEVLVRWQHQTKGLIPPLDFIAIAEETGFIEQLGFYVLKQACKQCQNWWEQGLLPFKLAVNVSIKQLSSGFSQKIKTLLESINFPVAQLELEITESSLMQSNSLAEIEKLSDLGITIAMDDFGTGHSSLAQLRNLPISTLKIDRSFIKEIPQNNNDLTMARTIIAMGHSLSLNIVAKGVETQQQLDFLKEEQCDQIQGYLFSKPLPANELLLLLKQGVIKSKVNDSVCKKPLFLYSSPRHALNSSSLHAFVSSPLHSLGRGIVNG
jgi:diguanylate cyclase (GGDEF)-like protein